MGSAFAMSLRHPLASRYPGGYSFGTSGHSAIGLSTISKESAMCSPAPCHSCGKVTWAGCGAHVDEVMSQVTPERRCTCR